MNTIFKPEFLWGSASAAYQIEGAYQSDGKGASIWDVWAHIKGKTFQGTNGDVATDHYNRYKEDIRLMKEQGLKAYRFSISWARILPEGTGSINQEGIAFYNRLIDELIENEIEPVVTLYHWDLPQTLQDRYLGWESPQVVEDFENYASVCFEHYGDRIKYWIVMNEPNIFTQLGYMTALHPPGKTDERLFLLTYHHTALAHAKSVLRYKAMGLKGIIGSSIAFQPGYAHTDHPQDLKALKNFYDLGLWWYMDVYFKGEYPVDAVTYYQEKGIMPEVSDADLKLLSAGAIACDFIGINYYQTAMVAHNPKDGVGFQGMNTEGKKGSQKESGLPGKYKIIRNESLEYTDWDWAIDPDGLRYGMVQLNERYQLPILISENGLGAFDQMDELGDVKDEYRIDYLKKHILACEKAVLEGVDLLGYMTWSFTDLLSWLNGYQKRYGFVYIDFESEHLTRMPKASYYWYSEVIKNNGVLEGI